MKIQYILPLFILVCVSVKRKRGKKRRRGEQQRRDAALKEKEFQRSGGMQKRETERWMRSYRWLRSRGRNNVCFLSMAPSSGCYLYRLEEQSRFMCAVNVLIMNFGNSNNKWCCFICVFVSCRRKQAEQEEELRKKEKLKWVSEKDVYILLEIHSFYM